MSLCFVILKDKQAWSTHIVFGERFVEEENRWIRHFDQNSKDLEIFMTIELSQCLSSEGTLFLGVCKSSCLFCGSFFFSFWFFSVIKMTIYMLNFIIKVHLDD